jgi:dTDP-4-amino-4,6-dideoxygalactose transaminase
MDTQEPAIQLFVPTYDVEACLDQIKECLEVGWTGLGYKTIEFESAWASYTGLPHAHFLNSSTVGLQLALKVLKQTENWEDDSEIITTPITFVSTNHAILIENLVPKFCDVDETLNLNPESVRASITPKTKAIMFVGVGGSAANYLEISAIAKEFELKFIVDAAHMAGTFIGDKHAGFDADVTIFSFQAVKNLPTADSGMICFKEELLDGIVRKYSWLGIDKDTFARINTVGGNYKWQYDVPYLGYKANGNSIMAGIGLAQLPKLENDNKKRREISRLYEKMLLGIPGVSFIPQDANSISAQHLFIIRVNNGKRNELIDFLSDRKIFVGVHYMSNLRYAVYEKFRTSCPVAEKLDEEIISLPLHIRLSEADVKRVCNAIVEFFDFR